MANAGFTDCNDITGPNSFCDMTSAENILAVPGSCQFQRLKDDAAAQCPAGSAQFTMNGQGDYIGLTLVGCADGGKTCYPKSVLAALEAAGHSTASLTPCSVE
jgi:hypothetical protein